MTGRIDITRFVALTATNHAKTYGLYPRKGTIAIGADADLTIWDPEARRILRGADLHSGADYTPYEGMAVTGWPVTVILRGTPMIEEGAFTGPPAPGRHIARPGGRPESYPESLSTDPPPGV